MNNLSALYPVSESAVVPSDSCAPSVSLEQLRAIRTELSVSQPDTLIAFHVGNQYLLLADDAVLVLSSLGDDALVIDETHGTATFRADERDVVIEKLVSGGAVVGLIEVIGEPPVIYGRVHVREYGTDKVVQSVPMPHVPGSEECHALVTQIEENVEDIDTHYVDDGDLYGAATNPRPDDELRDGLPITKTYDEQITTLVGLYERFGKAVQDWPDYEARLEAVGLDPGVITASMEKEALQRLEDKLVVELADAPTVAYVKLHTLADGQRFSIPRTRNETGWDGIKLSCAADGDCKVELSRGQKKLVMAWSGDTKVVAQQQQQVQVLSPPTSEKVEVPMKIYEQPVRRMLESMGLKSAREWTLDKITAKTMALPELLENGARQPHGGEDLVLFRKISKALGSGRPITIVSENGNGDGQHDDDDVLPEETIADETARVDDPDDGVGSVPDDSDVKSEAQDAPARVSRQRSTKKGARQKRTLKVPKQKKPVRTKAPKKAQKAPKKEKQGRAPLNLHRGQVIVREYKGEKVTVKALGDGTFLYDGDVYKSLTAVALKVTGYSKVSGPKFFGLV